MPDLEFKLAWDLMIDKRKYPRINVSVLVSYDCYNDDGEVFEHGVGVVLDISQGGLLIETNHIIDANFVKVVFVNYDKKTMNTVGSVVHSRKCENGKTRTGICFHDSDNDNIRFVTNLIRTYHYSKKVALKTNPTDEIPASLHHD